MLTATLAVCMNDVFKVFEEKQKERAKEKFNELSEEHKLLFILMYGYPENPLDITLFKLDMLTLLIEENI